MRTGAPEPMVTSDGAEGGDPAAERAVDLPVAGGSLRGWSSGTGTPLLLVHGGPALTDPLAPLAAELSAAYHVVRYQQRGVPPSVTSGDRSVEGHVADAVAVMDDLGWERPWVLGYSWGGHLVMHLAVAHPQRVAGFAVIGSLGAVGDGGGEAMGQRLLGRLPPAARQRVDEITAREEAGEVTAEEEVEALRLLWPYYAGRPELAPPPPEPLAMDLDGSRATWESVAAHFERGTLEHGLPELRMPAVFIHGSEDPLPLETAERSAALVPGARLRVLPGVGHFPWAEQPGSILAILSEVIPAEA